MYSPLQQFKSIKKFTLAKHILAVCFVAISCTVPAAALANQCGGLFAVVTPDKQTVEFNLTKENFPQHQEQILEMARVLLKENFEQLKWGSEHRTMKDDLKPKIGTVVDTELTKLFTPDYIEGMFAKIGVLNNEPWEQTSSVFDVRTNGKIAFISETYRLRRKGKAIRYRAVYHDGREIRAVDQAELLLNFLPESTTIYRVMSEAERSAWVRGEKLKTRAYGAKIHFSPAPLDIPNGSVQAIKISRSELLALYRAGELEVNTYDTLMESTPEIRVDFEIVVVGESGISKIAPKMTEQLSNR